MKTLIIYNHPYEGSFCHALLEAAVRGAKRAGHDVSVIDLDADNFNPVMTGQDLLAFRQQQMIDPQARNYAEQLKQAQHLVFIFPIWWELMPARTKGFIDKVIFPGTTYEYTDSGYGMKTLVPQIQSTTVITTMNTPKPVYRFLYGNALKKALLKGTFKKSGLKNVRWLSFNQVKGSSAKIRQTWLEQVERIFANKT